jgi:gliding motility-associated-like protein
MKRLLHTLLVAAVIIVTAFPALAQQLTGCPGVPGACGYPAQQVQRSGPSQPAPQNGNGTLGQIYNFSKCGLGFVQASQRLGRRLPQPGVLQPATFAISGIPACAVIEQAYLWAEGSGNGMAQTATITNPASTTQAFPMTLVGSGPDKCWGYAGSHTYRANVTSIISGNGNYIISGILTNPPTAGNDMDGATLMIIYSDPTATFTGTMIIHDGAVVVNGGTTTRTLTGMNVCQNVTAANATAFCMVGDIQMAGQNLTMNATPAPFAWNWWNYVQVGTTLTTGQTTANYTLSSGGDCFNLCVIGMYYRTTCVPCTTSALAVAPTTTQATCNNCNGSATVNVTPAGSYNYSWAPAGGNAATATGLCPGTYTCTVSNACNTATVAVTITSNGGGLSVSNTAQTNIDCYGNCIGAATVSVTGGNGPLTYSWAPNVSASATASNLCAGTYVATVTDGAGCFDTETITITQPPQLTATPTQTDVLCFGGSSGSATLTSGGGAGNNTYTWVPNVPNTTNGNANTASSLPANTYVATVTDANGCTATTTFIITEPPQLTVSVSSQPSTCNNSNGSVTATPSGGSGAPTYLWTPGNATSQTVNNLAPGAYSVLITDANGCTASAGVSVIATATPVVSISTLTNVLCYNGNTGSATAVNNGGSAPFTCNWSNGDTSWTAGNLPAGTYTLTVTDANGCVDTTSVTITQPAQLTSTQTSADAACFGAATGTASMTGNGGTGAYTFTWTPAATSTVNGNTSTGNNMLAGSYVCTVTDANGCTDSQTIIISEPPQMTVQMQSSPAYCNQSNGYVNAIGAGGTGNLNYLWNPGNLAQQSSNVIPPGMYSVTVTDSNNCTITDSVQVANTPGVILTANAPTSVSCYNGSDGAASVTATNGLGQYTYAWSPNVSTTNSASQLVAGNYVVVVFDSTGCTATTTVTVTQPVQLTVSAAVNPAAVCAGQPVTLTATPFGGTPGYQAAWAPVNLIGLQPSFTPTTSTPVTLTITDLNGCTATATTSITVNPLPTPQFAGDVLQGCAPHCVNFSELSGPGNWVWNWDFGDGNTGTGSGSPNHCYNLPGTYSVQLTLTDAASGCSTTVSTPNYITVFANPVAGFSFTPNDPSMVNPNVFFSDASTGATAWVWNFGDLLNSSSTQQNPMFTYPDPGCYAITQTVTSTDGCTDIATDSVCVTAEASLFIPNAFTPDGDGINDVFIPLGIGIDATDYQFWIYDRWGNLIFFTDNPQIGWDGKANNGKDIAQIDTYVWRLKYSDVTGTKHNQLGRVSLIK